MSKKMNNWTNCTNSMAPVSCFECVMADQYLNIMLISLLLCLLAIIIIINSHIRI